VKKEVKEQQQKVTLPMKKGQGDGSVLLHPKVLMFWK
jgi:hypothetical protein